MNGDNLIRMANQIGTFFASMPDRTEALEGFATHLRKFWDPRMRRAFLALADDDTSRQQMHALVQESVQQHRALLGAGLAEP